MSEAKTEKKAPAAEDTTNYGAGDKEIVDARKAAPYYCPGCGKAFQDEHAECVGTAGGPHAPIAVVSTAELSGDPADQTAAPSTEQ